MKFNYTTEMRVDTLPTGRTYHTPSGSYASITTILGKTSPNQVWLQRWKDNVGEEEAARISKAATDRGTLIHEYVEKYFNSEDISCSLAQEPTDIQFMTNNLIKGVSSGIQEIYGQEQILWSNKYRYAGRTDMVGVWKGKPSIIDFKTSKKPKTDAQIRDYYLQCCSYAVAHNELFGTGIKDAVVVITTETNTFQVFEKSLPPFLYELKNRINTFYSMTKEH
jgi:ATP-dependent exoDNAse (exonuclease V) beta subunit